MDINGIKPCVWQIEEGVLIAVHGIKESVQQLPEPLVELWHLNKNLAVTLYNKDHACTHVHTITWHECNKRKLNIKYYRKPIILVYIFLSP